MSRQRRPGRHLPGGAERRRLDLRLAPPPESASLPGPALPAGGPDEEQVLQLYADMTGYWPAGEPGVPPSA